jgi:DHA2 family methylenomycin A resistance protein-like MFS transporter
VIDAGLGGPAAVPATAGALAGLLLVALVVAERRAADPMLPLVLFRRPAFSTTNAVAGAMNLGTLGLLFVVTLYLQSVQDRSALAAGLALLPLFLPLTVLAPVAGRLTARRGPAPAMVAGLALAAVGVALLARLSVGSTYSDLQPALLLWGVGLGLLTPAVVATAVGAVGGGRTGLASGMNNTARQACGAVGIAVYGAVAGRPSRPATFVPGLHHLGLATAALFAVAAGASALFLRGAPSSDDRADATETAATA